MILLRRYRKSFSLPKEKKKKDYDLLWDHMGWQRDDGVGYQPMNQMDWNQTLITKINQCSAQTHKRFNKGGANVIECGTNLEYIFDDLEYYNSDKKELGSRYKVTFKKELQSTIRVYHDKNPEFVMIVKTKGVKEEYFADTTTNNRRRLLCKKKK